MSLPVILMLFALCAHAGDQSGATTLSAVREVGRSRVKSLVEASGIVASTAHLGVFWTHNDGGDGVLYAIHQDGSPAGKVRITQKFDDWEDIACDGEGRLYLADTGNNARNRKRIMVHRIAEPDPAAAGDVDVQETYKLSFPEEPFDCESLFIWKDHGYLISKTPSLTPATVYRFSLTPSKKPRMLEKFADLPADEPITAAAISHDGRRLAVLTRRNLTIFDIDGKIESVKDAKRRQFRIPPVQAEGCCFTPEGVLIIAETGEMFLAPDNGPATTQVAR